MLFSSRASAKDLHVTQASQLPFYNINADASWRSQALIENVQFIDYSNVTTHCGKR